MTLTAPAVPAGVVQVMEVALTTVTIVAAVPPMVTPVAPVKSVPVRVTLVPPAVVPLVGLMAVTVGAPAMTVSVNELVAVLPAASRTTRLIVAVPNCPVAGVTVTVRLPPMPPSTMLASGSSVVLPEVAVTVSPVVFVARTKVTLRPAKFALRRSPASFVIDRLGMVIVASVPPNVGGAAPRALLAMNIPMPPAACTFLALSRNDTVPRSTSTILPAAWAALFRAVAAMRGSASTTSPVRLKVWAPKSAGPATSTCAMLPGVLTMT